MLMLPYLWAFVVCGILCVRLLLPRLRPLYRLWTGVVLGLYLLMWLPALAAFLDAFSSRGHLLALIPLALMTLGAYAARDKRPVAPWEDRDSGDLRVMAYVVLPLTVIGAYLQWTHNLRPIDGALYVGQSTYGDLSLHTGIITSLPGARFPVDYNILPGVRLSYPFLMNSLSASFLVFGCSLQAALVLPGTLMMSLVFVGFALLALRLADRRRAAVLAFLLVFINGGLGFLYSFDMAGASLGTLGENQLQQGTWLSRLGNILQGWYQTPVNHAEFGTYNLRWSNIIADMLVPQRTFLAGWVFLMPCLYLLWEAMHDREQPRLWLAAGFLAGGMPLIHTHSFLALGLCSAGFMLAHIRRGGKWLPWFAYGALACLMALPQLFHFTFAQAGGSEGFVQFRFNWVNNPGGLGLRDGYLWFYLKNIGLPFLLLIPSLFEREKKHRLLYTGAFTIFLAAELVLFQPNEYDNNKLFYVWYALCAVPISEYTFVLWDRLRGLRARSVLGGLACVVFFLSGSLSLMREGVSSYQAYSPAATTLADYVKAHTPAHSVFLTGWEEHLNPVSALSGRSIVSGPDLWLYYHGLDTGDRKADIARFYADPRANEDVIAKYSVRYVLLGPGERGALMGDEDVLDALYKRVYTDPQGTYIVYEVTPG